MPQLLVIADDLTGANDVGVQFVRRGVPAAVMVHPARNLGDLFRRFEVVVVDSESRHLPPEVAQQRVAEIVREGASAGVNYFYKKTDSTLRGNIGAELEGLIRASGAKHLCFIPGLPELGRTTCGGIQYVHGRPLHETDFARDARDPWTESRVAAVLKAQTDLAVRELSRPTSGGDFEGITVFDIAATNEYWQIGRGLVESGELGAVAATAGFAQALPDLMEFSRESAREAAIASPILLVNGSLNPVSFGQSARARAAGFKRYVIPPNVLFGKDAAAEQAFELEVAEDLNRKRNVAIQTLASRDELENSNREAAAVNIGSLELHDYVASRVGRITTSIVSKARPGTLIVFGGDTLLGIARASEWTRFMPVAEPIPGVTCSQVFEEPGLLVISKAGGFGSPNLIPDLVERSTRAL